MSEFPLRGTAPITIQRNPRTGLLHVHATSKLDALRGLGACHAIDRGMQMLLLRCFAHGRASELLSSSEELLAVDIFARRAGFARSADTELAKLDPAERACVNAYCDGVNQVLQRRRPWELRLRGFPFTPWSGADCVTMSRLVSYVGLAQGQGELERLVIQMIQAGASCAHLEELFPGQLDGLDDELIGLIRQTPVGEATVPPEVLVSTLIPKTMASNNWVLAPGKTRSGRALLCNDPHLDIQGLPGFWYECALAWGEDYAMGAGVAGMPSLVIARTRHAAWGVTYSFLDGIDSWIEQIRDGHYRRIVDGTERWLPLTVRQEIIRRRGKPDHLLEISEIGSERDGPGFHGRLDHAAVANGYRFATRWASGTETGARSLGAMIRALDARNTREALAAFGQMESAWNWVAADSDGHIGYQMSGLMPLRRAGASGLLPLRGWDPANDWQGFADCTELPRTFDPPEGFFVTANNDLGRHGLRRPQNCAMGAWRAERIAQLLVAREDWDVDASRALQMDVYSLQADALLAAAKPAIGAHPAAARLYAWDRRYTPDSTEAVLFEDFYRQLFHEVFGTALGRDATAFLIKESAMFADFYDSFDNVLLRRENSLWFGNRSRDAIYRAAFEQAAKAEPTPLRERQTITMSHVLFGGRLPRWLGFDRAGVTIPGGRATVHQAQLFRFGGRAGSFTASYRFVTDMAEDAIHSVLPAGVSDRRFSRWYLSDLPNWIAGRLKTTRPESLV